jgi:hypothetical protein
VDLDFLILCLVHMSSTFAKFEIPDMNGSLDSIIDFTRTMETTSGVQQTDSPAKSTYCRVLGGCQERQADAAQMH